MKSQSTKNPVRIIPCGALFESYGQTLDPSKYCPELPEAQCMLAGVVAIVSHEIRLRDRF